MRGLLRRSLRKPFVSGSTTAFGVAMIGALREHRDLVAVQRTFLDRDRHASPLSSPIRYGCSSGTFKVCG